VGGFGAPSCAQAGEDMANAINKALAAELRKQTDLLRQNFIEYLNVFRYRPF